MQAFVRERLGRGCAARSARCPWPTLAAAPQTEAACIVAPLARPGLRLSGERTREPVRGGPGVSPVDAAATNVGAGNWRGLGLWAWPLFRIAGIVLVVYLFAHIRVVSSARSSG